jgi:hypothetical protein
VTADGAAVTVTVAVVAVAVATVAEGTPAAGTTTADATVTAAGMRPSRRNMSLLGSGEASYDPNLTSPHDRDLRPE